MTPDKPMSVPRLRFPEFSEDGAWQETAIGNMGEVITGSTPSTSRRDFYGGDFMFVSPTDISDLRFVEETKTTLTEAGFAECRPIKKNSVLFVCIGSIGKVAQCSRLCATNQQINSLVASPAFLADFAYYLLDRESVRIARLAGTQVLPIINKSLFAKVKVTAPAFAEQRKIADCLGSLDDLIAAEGRKLDALRQHKQGLLQRLFPQSGETVPRLRFPEFKDAPAWEEELLGNLVAIVSGKSPSQYTLFAEGDFAFVKVEDLNNCSKYQVAARQYCNDDRDTVPSSSIVFPKRGAAIENNKIRITASEILIDTNLMALTPWNKKDTEFLYYFLVRVGLARSCP